MENTSPRRQPETQRAAVQSAPVLAGQQRSCRRSRRGRSPARLAYTWPPAQQRAPVRRLHSQEDADGSSFCISASACKAHMLYATAQDRDQNSAAASASTLIKPAGVDDLKFFFFFSPSGTPPRGVRAARRR